MQVDQQMMSQAAGQVSQFAAHGNVTQMNEQMQFEEQQQQQQQQAPMNECMAKLQHLQQLVTILQLLQFVKPIQKEQAVTLAINKDGFKFAVETQSKDVIAIAWLPRNGFQEFQTNVEDWEICLPLGPFITCLQVFSQHAAVDMHFCDHQLRLIITEDGNSYVQCMLVSWMSEDADALDEHIVEFGKYSRDSFGIDPKVLRDALDSFWDDPENRWKKDDDKSGPEGSVRSDFLDLLFFLFRFRLIT